MFNMGELLVKRIIVAHWKGGWGGRLKEAVFLEALQKAGNQKVGPYTYNTKTTYKQTTKKFFYRPPTDNQNLLIFLWHITLEACQQ